MEICQNPEILRVIMFISQILKVVFIIVPIGLILMIGLDLFKNITAGKEDDMKKNVSIAIKRIIMCVCVFFVPTIVNLVNSIVNEALEDTEINYAECLKNATASNIENIIEQNAKETVEKAKIIRTMNTVIEAETAVENLNEGQLKNDLKMELKTIKEEVKQEIINNIEEETKNPVKPSTGNNNDGSSGGTTEILTNGIQGKYFAPAQQKGLYFYGKPTDHDLGTETGTPLYAGMDGTAYFFQAYTTVNGVNMLYSYGNFINLIGKDGTTITYAHLDRFIEGINAPIKKSLSYPCGVSNYSGTTGDVGKMQVKKGQLIGYTGNTGNSTGPHLHVEIYEAGKGKVTDLDAAFGY